jgi:hypothetical protein
LKLLISAILIYIYSLLTNTNYYFILYFLLLFIKLIIKKFVFTNLSVVFLISWRNVSLHLIQILINRILRLYINLSYTNLLISQIIFLLLKLFCSTWIVIMIIFILFKIILILNILIYIINKNFKIFFIPIDKLLWIFFIAAYFWRLQIIITFLFFLRLSFIIWIKSKYWAIHFKRRCFSYTSTLNNWRTDFIYS